LKIDQAKQMLKKEKLEGTISNVTHRFKDLFSSISSINLESKELNTLENGQVWQTIILPNWNNLKNTKRVKKLCRLGVPPFVRGNVWKKCIGNKANITLELFNIGIEKSKRARRYMDKKMQNTSNSSINSLENSYNNLDTT